MTRHLDRPSPSPAMLPSRTLIDHLGLSRGRCRDVLSLQLSSTTTPSDSITTSNLLPPKLERGVRVFYHFKRWPPPKLGLLDKPPAFEEAAGKECLKRDSYHRLFQCFEMYRNVSKCFSITLITPKCKSRLMSPDSPIIDDACQSQQKQ